MKMKTKVQKIKEKKNDKKKMVAPRPNKVKSKKLKDKKGSFQQPVVEDTFEAEDVADMISDDELEYMKNNFSYNGTLAEDKIDKLDNIEDKYEQFIANHLNKDTKKVRYMLPIKTQNGLLKNQVLETVSHESEEEDESEKTSESDENETKPTDIPTEPLPVSKLLATREETLQSKKVQIGSLCSNILENPELNLKMIGSLLDLLNEKNPETYITVQKLTMVSLLEVFKDILPNYHILDIKQEGVRFKKDTLKIQNYEQSLLKYYKQYLLHLEKRIKLLRKSYPKTELVKREVESHLASIAASCMGDLLVTHPYFNFANNIANFLLPFLNCKQAEVRKTVAKAFCQVFKQDSRAELSLQIVKSLDKYIKQRKHSVHFDVLQVLLSLKVSEVDLEKEKETEVRKKQLMEHKKRIINLSKKERKRNKKLEEIDREMLETKAEENKEAKNKRLTEITSIVFTIYFRILKQAPNSKVLSVCLEGLSKFSHCINVEYYQDIVNCLHHLMENEPLSLQDRLNCISTTFIILSGHGSNLNIDPRRFYTSLYKDLFSVINSTNKDEVHLIIKVLTQALVHRHKSIELSKMVGFLKRMSTVSLSLPHNGILGMLTIVKILLQFQHKARVLLNTDNVGNGVYLPELDEPEYCNANCTSLYELVALQRHYHSVVRNIAKNIAFEMPATGQGSLLPEIFKKSPEELFTEYDPSNVSFKPSIPPPKRRKTE